MIQATPLLEDYRITGTITEIKQSGHVISKNSQVLIEDIEKYKTASDLRFSVFHDLVDKLKETMLELNKDWKSDESLIDNPKSFFRIWSALQFVFSCPQSQGQVTNREIFGESLAWAGCMMIHCLGQRDLFFAFDYASHILECEKNDKKSSKSEVRGDVALFLKSSLILRQENDFIFSFLGIN